jgi:hypothetical protein
LDVFGDDFSQLVGEILGRRPIQCFLVGGVATGSSRSSLRYSTQQPTK